MWQFRKISPLLLRIPYQNINKYLYRLNLYSKIWVNNYDLFYVTLHSLSQEEKKFKNFKNSASLAHWSNDKTELAKCESKCGQIKANADQILSKFNCQTMYNGQFYILCMVLFELFHKLGLYLYACIVYTSALVICARVWVSSTTVYQRMHRNTKQPSYS